MEYIYIFTVELVKYNLWWCVHLLYSVESNIKSKKERKKQSCKSKFERFLPLTFEYLWFFIIFVVVVISMLIEFIIVIYFCVSFFDNLYLIGISSCVLSFFSSYDIQQNGSHNITWRCLFWYCMVRRRWMRVHIYILGVFFHLHHHHRHRRIDPGISQSLRMWIWKKVFHGYP